MEDKESRIMESARKFFFRYGFKKTSMDEIAEDAGVGKGTLYNYFKNKTDLFVRVGEMQRDEIQKGSEKSAESVSGFDEKLIQSILYSVEVFHGIKKRYAMSAAVMQELMITGMNLVEHIKEDDTYVMNCLREGEKQQTFKPGDHLKTANLLNRINKTFFLRWTQMKLEDARVEIREIYELIFKGLRVNSPSN